MKKTSLILAFILSLTTVFSGTATAAIAPSPSGGVYASYAFSASESGDVSRNMSCKTSGTHTEYGLKLTPFTEVADTVKGGTTTVKNAQTSNALFNVTTAPSGYNDYYVEVEYLNYSYGFFNISYTDKSGKTKTTELVCCEDTGDLSKPIADRVKAASKITESGSEYKTHIFRLENVDFSKSNDFSVETIRTAKSSRFEYSPKSVYIKNVKVYREDKLPVKAQIKSGKTGNIFYDRDLPEFSVTFTNNTDSDADFSVNLNVYKYTTDGEPVLEDNLSKQVLKDETVKKSESVVKSFSLNVSGYGLYLLEADITSNGRTYTAASAEFSKCVGNDGKNASFGVGMHTGTWDAGTLKNYMTLARNAGFGLVRDGITWGVYEKSNGTSSLRSTDMGFYKICNEYGMDPYIVIDVTNPRACVDKSNSGLPDSGALEGITEFINNLLDEPDMQNVNHFELCNEPNIKIYYDENENKLKYTGDTKDERISVYTAKGKAYGKICERMIDAIRAKRGSTAEIGILSLCGIDSKFDKDGNRYIWNGRYCADNFIKGALDYLSDPNGDGNKADTKLNDVDVITYHPYSYLVNPEVINERDLTGVTDVAKTYGMNTANAWHTEFGWSTAKYPSSSACIGDDYAQAKNIIRQYASMYTRNNSDKLFIYDFIDDDIVTNAQESNYGLIHSELYSTPYAAKLSYLAVSNLNKMTAGLTNAEFAYNTVDDLYTGDYTTETNGYGTKGEMVAKFSGSGEKTVYMLWGIEDNKEISYKIPENVIAYYDFLGNRIDPSTVETEKGYTVSTEPFYAVCGEDINASIIGTEDNKVKFTVEGKTKSGNYGDTVILLVSDRDVSSSKNINNGNLLYANFCTSSADGYYRFDCGAISTESKAYAYIIEADGTETKTPISLKHSGAELNLFKNMQKIDASYVSLKNLDDISVIGNVRSDAKANSNAKLIISFFKGGELMYLTTCELENSYAEKAISAPDGTEYDKVGIFLWDGFKTVKPLCNNIYIK